MSEKTPRFLRCSDNCYHIDGNGIAFGAPYRFLARDIPLGRISETARFAFGMTVDSEGFHRDHRSGGKMKRTPYHIFVNVFHGKLGEWCLYDYLSSLGDYHCSEPDMEVYPRGIWDNGDATVTNDNDDLVRIVAIKTTKRIGNLLLLETADWSAEGLYLPSSANGLGYVPNRFVLMRIDPFLSVYDKELESLVNKKDYNGLLSFVMDSHWRYDVPGFITDDDFKFLAKERYVIPQNSFLNKKDASHRMDAENYYIASKWMRPMPTI